MKKRKITVYNDCVELKQYDYVSDVVYPSDRPDTVAFTDEQGSRIIVTGGVIIDETE